MLDYSHWEDRERFLELDMLIVLPAGAKAQWSEGLEGSMRPTALRSPRDADLDSTCRVAT